MVWLLKPSSISSVWDSITFAIRRPEDHRAPPSSTHTYRLLVFKEHSQEAPCFHRVAASAAEKRDYEEPFSFRQQVFLASPEKPCRLHLRAVSAATPSHHAQHRAFKRGRES